MEQRLRFKETLTWRAGRAIPVAELLRRLKALSAELKELDQEKTDTTSLTSTAKELVGSHLVNHKEASVKAWTAVCLADVLQICAPDAPYTPAQLKVE